MKKLVVMLLAVAMTVAFASSVMAADLSWWMGGDFYYYFASEKDGLSPASGVFTVDSILTAQLTEGNSWAKMWFVKDTWNDSLYYAFGYNKIGGILDLGFSTKDTGIANIGQNPLGEFFNDFKADPIFNTYDMGGAMSAVFNTENFTLKAEYVVLNTVPAWMFEAWAVSGAFKFDGGDFHFGYKDPNAGTDASVGMVGANFMVGEAKVAVDVYFEGDDAQRYGWDNDGTNLGPTGNYGEIGFGLGEYLQANVAFEKFDITLAYGRTDVDGDDDLLGLGFAYKATDKLTVALKYFDRPNDTQPWEVYGLYDLGAFDVKFGVADLEDGNDTQAVLGFHASIW